MIATTPKQDLDRLTRAAVGLVLDAPFFGALVSRLDRQLGPVKTACTDGSKIIFDPAWLGTLADKRVRTVIAHEVLHCALGHHVRRGARDAVRWNRACDYVVDGILYRIGQEAEAKGQPNPFDLPPEALLDPRYSAEGVCAEEVYAQLPEDPPGGSEDSTDGVPGSAGEPGDMGQVTEPKDGAATQAERQQALQDWQQALQQAEQCARMQGCCPGAVESLLDGINRGHVPWQELLRSFVRQQAKDDWTWKRPNRRYVAAGVYLPGLYSLRCGPVVVGVDVSGSCHSLIPAFMSEVQSILDEVRPEKLAVVQDDAAVQNVREYAPGDVIDREIQLGGGTDFRPVFEWVAGQDWEPVCLVYLTDLYGSFPDSPPDYPVLWVTPTRDTVAPFGDTALMRPGLD